MQSYVLEIVQLVPQRKVEQEWSALDGVLANALIEIETITDAQRSLSDRRIERQFGADSVTEGREFYLRR
jgi:hypothetical protein